MEIFLTLGVLGLVAYVAGKMTPST